MSAETYLWNFQYLITFMMHLPKLGSHLGLIRLTYPWREAKRSYSTSDKLKYNGGNKR